MTAIREWCKQGPGLYRHDANLALARLDDAGAIGSYQASLCLVLQHLLHFHLPQDKHCKISIQWNRCSDQHFSCKQHC